MGIQAFHVYTISKLEVLWGENLSNQILEFPAISVLRVYFEVHDPGPGYRSRPCVILFT